MSAERCIVILHGRVAVDAPPDEQDVLEEVRQVSVALGEMGFTTIRLPLSLDLESAARELRRLAPLLVFNLVESIEGRDRLLHLAPSLLDSCGIPYTGTGSRPMILASDKILAKRLFVQGGIDTPQWSAAEELICGGPDFEPPYILKSVWDNGSSGLGRIFTDGVQLQRYLVEAAATAGVADLFVERYIPGREFNISLLQNGRHVEVLPVAEMLFIDYPPEKPRIVDYAAKWDPASFEYSHTVRRFDFAEEEGGLLDRLTELAAACWAQLGMDGYARADFRVDPQGTPWILEVNPNPCISADAGLASAAFRAGMSYKELVGRILRPVLERSTSRVRAAVERTIP
jgi:D-alanine-D-alanine ligase